MNEEKNKEKYTKADLITFSFDVGWNILLFLTPLSFLGWFLDKTFSTKPIFLVSGLIISIIPTNIIIYRKAKKFIDKE